jgi:hypothetical protein
MDRQSTKSSSPAAGPVLPGNQVADDGVAIGLGEVSLEDGPAVHTKADYDVDVDVGVPQRRHDTQLSQKCPPHHCGDSPRATRSGVVPVAVWGAFSHGCWGLGVNAPADSNNARRDQRFQIYRSGPSRDWIKVKNPNSPAMMRAREIEW